MDLPDVDAKLHLDIYHLQLSGMMITKMMMTKMLMTDLEGTRDDDTIQSWSWSLQQCILEHNNVDFNLDDDVGSHLDENDNDKNDNHESNNDHD